MTTWSWQAKSCGRLSGKRGGMRLNSKQICRYVGGTLLVEPVDASKLACGITWDSRKLAPDDVYVALPGLRVDGHRFVADALRGGAAVVLVTDRPDAATCLLAKEMGAAIIEVSSTVNAITDLARAWRASFCGRVVAITGSSGKTTTKNLVRDVLKASFKVVATEGNQNNELGVPKTILEADPETEVIVIEMGMRGIGQIRELCGLVAPDMGLITNIGDAHLELLRTRENIARAKAELFQSLPPGRGVAFMNRSDGYADFVRGIAELEAREVRLVWYDGSGTLDAQQEAPTASWGAWVDAIELDAQGRPSFMLHLGGEESPCTLPLQGLHNVHNAAAAASVGAAFGMNLATIVAALKEAVPEWGRQETLKARSGFTVINDSYNANPDSMRAALIMFAAMETTGRHIAILGDMGELGDAAQACHEGIGALVADLAVDYVVCIGELGAFIAQGARDAGMSDARVKHVLHISDILEELDTYLLPDDVVLVKASRFMGLERVVGGLVN